jgi:hypothetical protein
MVIEVTAEQEFYDRLLSMGTDRMFVYVDLDRLRIDPRYQREVNAQRVRKMAGEYDENLMGVLVCSVRPEGVFVIDGQHRLEVARSLGHPTIRCELRVGLTLEQEAHIFYSLDTKRVALNSDDAFRALITAQDPTALAIEKAIIDSGLRVSYSGPLLGGVRAYKTLLKLTNQYGIESIRRVLRVLAGAYAETDHPAPSAVLEGLVHFFTVYPDVADRELVHALRTHATVTRLLSESREMSGSLAWNSKKSMARAILTAFNKGKREDNRLSEAPLNGE